MRPSDALTYDQQYTLKDSDGSPLANVRYRVSIDGDVLKNGVTDSQGQTERIATGEARRLTLEIIGGN